MVKCHFFIKSHAIYVWECQDYRIFQLQAYEFLSLASRCIFVWLMKRKWIESLPLWRLFDRTRRSLDLTSILPLSPSACYKQTNDSGFNTIEVHDRWFRYSKSDPIFIDVHQTNICNCMLYIDIYTCLSLLSFST